MFKARHEVRSSHQPPSQPPGPAPSPARMEPKAKPGRVREVVGVGVGARLGECVQQAWRSPCR